MTIALDCLMAPESLRRAVKTDAPESSRSAAKIVSGTARAARDHSNLLGGTKNYARESCCFGRSEILRSVGKSCEFNWMAGEI